jgi:hypothetical protein
MQNITITITTIVESSPKYSKSDPHNHALAITCKGTMNTFNAQGYWLDVYFAYCNNNNNNNLYFGY